MSVSLAEAAERAFNDPDILNLTAEVALLQARLNQLLGNIDSEMSLQRWKQAKEAFRNMIDAGARKDEVGYATGLDDLKRIFRDGDKDFLVWQDIIGTLKELRGAVKQEQARRVEMHAMVSADQAVGMLSELMYVIKENVDDPKAINAIYMRAQEIINRDPNKRRGASAD